jgi:hypothetical protein
MRPSWQLADVFNRLGDDYPRRQSLSLEQRKAFEAIRRCRTAALGGHIDACDQCGYLRISYNSCRNRHCPKCQQLAKEEWLDARLSNLLPVPYFHFVFTLPHELQPLVRFNERILYNLLFETAWSSLQQLALDPRFVGAHTGMIAVLHTWGQNLHFHPHIHCIVPAGGWCPKSKKWKPARKHYLLPVKALSRLFRGKFLAALKVMQQNQSLILPNDYSSTSVSKLLQQLYAKEWVVYAKPPFAGPRSLLEYLGRYTHRVAISNERILNVSDQQVTFRYRDYADASKVKAMTMDMDEFARRFLQHVLPAGFRKIRYCGILANRTQSVALAACRKALKVKPPVPKPKLDWKEKLYQLTGVDPTRCPRCEKGQMKLVEVVTQPRPPPQNGAVLAIYSPVAVLPAID